MIPDYPDYAADIKKVNDTIKYNEDMIKQIRSLLEVEEAKITALQSDRTRKQEEAAAQEAAAANEKLYEESKLAVEAATA